MPFCVADYRFLATVFITPVSAYLIDLSQGDRYFDTKVNSTYPQQLFRGCGTGRLIGFFLRIDLDSI
jgi:hypothetical protein